MADAHVPVRAHRLGQRDAGPVAQVTGGILDVDDERVDLRRVGQGEKLSHLAAGAGGPRVEIEAAHGLRLGHALPLGQRVLHREGRVGGGPAGQRRQTRSLRDRRLGGRVLGRRVLASRVLASRVMRARLLRARGSALVAGCGSVVAERVGGGGPDRGIGQACLCGGPLRGRCLGGAGGRRGRFLRILADRAGEGDAARKHHGADSRDDDGAEGCAPAGLPGRLVAVTVTLQHVTPWVYVVRGGSNNKIAGKGAFVASLSRRKPCGGRCFSTGGSSDRRRAASAECRR